MKHLIRVFVALLSLTLSKASCSSLNVGKSCQNQCIKVKSVSSDSLFPNNTQWRALKDKYGTKKLKDKYGIKKQTNLQDAQTQISNQDSPDPED